MKHLRTVIAAIAAVAVLAATVPGPAIAGSTVHATATSAPADAYEHDDSAAAARDVTALFAVYGGEYYESRTIDHVDTAVADEDWIKFTASADDVNIDKTSFMIRTQSTDNDMDTVIEVYGPHTSATFPHTPAHQSGADDPLAVDSNDDDPWKSFAYDSCLVFRPTAPGTYYVRIRPWANSADQFVATAGDYDLILKKGLLGRIAGDDRIETALKASRALYQDHAAGPGTRNAGVVIANAYNYPDALGGSLLCGIADGPLLLTRTEVLSPGVADEIKRLGVNRVYVVGGPAAVSDSVFSALQAIHPSIAIYRVAGDDRIWTAAEVAEQARADVAGYSETMPGLAIVAYAYNYPDALAASAFATARNVPVLLTGTATLAKDTADIMTHLGTTDVIIMGGTTVIAPAVETQLAARFGASHVMRIAGSDRYETAKEFASWACDLKGPGSRGDGKVGLPAAPSALDRLNPMRFGIASGETFADALPGGVACGLSGSVPGGFPILLNRKATPYGYVTSEFDGSLPAGDTDWMTDVHNQTTEPFGPSMVFGGFAAITGQTGAILDNSIMLVNAP